MKKISAYRLAHCVIAPAAREIYAEGIQRQVDPKVFDLLVYLVENRHRVVPRDELLQHLWPSVVVTDGAVTRTVMLARKTVDEAASNRSQIKTIHRIGYRYVGAVAREEVSEPDAAAPTNQGRADDRDESRPVRLALLPFVNDTGEPRLIWLELGLPSLIEQALASDSRMVVLSSANLLAALDQSAGLRSLPEQVKRIQQSAEPDWVVVATVTRSESEFSLEVQGTGPRLARFGTTLRGYELTEIALDLARMLEAQIFPRSTQDLQTHSTDPFVNECYARAMDAVNREQFELAAVSLDVVVDLEPDNAVGSFHRARVLSALGDPRAHHAAQVFLRISASTGSSLLEAMACHLLAFISFELDHDLPAAELQIERAFGLVPEAASSDWYLEALVLRSRIARVQGDERAARQASERALYLGPASLNQILQITIRAEAAILESQFSDAAHARSLLEAVGPVAEAHALFPIWARVTLALAGVEGIEGRLERARQRIAGLTTRLATRTTPLRQLLYLSLNPLLLCYEIRDYDTLVSFGRELVRLVCAREEPLALWFRNFVDALVSGVRGNFPQAALKLAEASACLDAQKHQTLLGIGLLVLVETQIKTAQPLAAELSQSRVHDLRQFTRIPTTKARLLHLRALQACLDADRSLARVSLREAVALRAPGLWDVYCRIDLAWLLLLEHDVSEAGELVLLLGEWLERHPAGLLTAALLSHTSGQFELSRKLFERHLSLVGGRKLSWFTEIGANFGCAFDRSTYELLRHFPYLPTSYARTNLLNEVEGGTTRVSQVSRTSTKSG